MRVKRFVATSIEEAMSKIKLEMGPNAVILHTRYFKEGGFLGFFKRNYVEVTAATEDGVNPVSPIKPLIQSAEYAATTQNSPSTNNLINEATQSIPATNINFVSTTGTAKTDTSLFRSTPLLELPKSPEINVAQDDIIGNGINQEITQMKKMMSEMTQILEENSATPPYPKAGKVLYNRLKKQGVEERLARRVVKNTLQQVSLETSPQEDLIEEIFRNSLLKPLKKSKPIRIANSPLKKPKIFALVGPTGVGKTTTIAKLAAMFAITEKRRVAFVTVDTYRIAAVEQLRTIADIMDVPVRVVYSVNQMQECLLELAEHDLIFIDTAGRSHKNEEQLTELKAYLDIAHPDETFLVMSSTGNYQDMLDILKAYQDFNISRLIFTKIDETSFYGSIYNVVCRSKIPLAYITTGQDIPDDIEAADPVKLVQLLLMKE